MAKLWTNHQVTCAQDVVVLGSPISRFFLFPHIQSLLWFMKTEIIYGQKGGLVEHYRFKGNSSGKTWTYE